MTQFSRLFLVALFAILSVMLVANARAEERENEAKAIEAPAREQVIEASKEAQQKDLPPAKETPGATLDETHTPDAADAADTIPQEVGTKGYVVPEVEGNIADIETITAYDHEKVIGHAKDWQMFFQPASSKVMEQIISLHNLVTIIAIVMVLFVLALLTYVCIRFSAKRNPVPQKFSHNTLVEIVWTVIPILILIAIAIPSVRIHYNYTNNQDVIDNPDITLKVVGRQWYWSYEYPDLGIAYDSNIVADADLVGDEPRLLTVDNPVVVPVGKVIRVQVTGADVIHAWDMPSMGVKQDVVPGRLNETWFKAERTGIFYGQCSEICGKYHGFMPIELHVVSEEDFARWVAAAKLKFAADGSRQYAANQ